MRLFVCAYGSRFVTDLEDYAIRSLRHKLNKPGLEGATVSLYCDAEQMKRAAEICSSLDIPVEQHVITIDSDPANIQQRCIQEEIERCLECHEAMVMVCPDNYWGGGTLPNLIAIAGKTPGVCLAVPHPRVNRGQFPVPISTASEGKLIGPDNPSLVHLAMMRLHPSWEMADQSLENTSSYLAGIGFSRIGEKLYAVSHLLPTVFYATFTEHDLCFFREARARGLKGIWDHHWPSLLVKQGRQRVVASSDAAFIVELTDMDSHNVQLLRNEPGKFHRVVDHVNANRNVTAIWRADPQEDWAVMGPVMRYEGGKLLVEGKAA